MSLTVEQGTTTHLAACLALADLVLQGLVAAAEDDRLRVALLEGEPVGYAVDAPWFLGAPFLQLVHVGSEASRHAAPLAR